MLCTSNTVFGQFHTITQQSKLYTIEQVPNPSDAGNNHNISATNADNATNRIHPVKRIDDKAPTPPGYIAIPTVFASNISISTSVYLFH